MFNLVKGAVASAIGTQEPVYGPEAIHSVAEQAKKTPHTVLTKPDQKWLTPWTSCVETQTFYIHSDAGHLVFVQVIYSNVAITATAQFNTQIYFLDDDKTPRIWSSDPLSNYKFENEKYDLIADKVSITLNEDGSAYTIKSQLNLKSIVELTFTRTAPGFVVGDNGTTTYGTDPKNPWGTMRHSFWPRCTVTGHILTQHGSLDMKGAGMYVHALQGMKPHHAAARWNFCNFQSPNYSAVLMQFTTPPAYASTVVNVGGIVKDDKLLFASADSTAEHTKIKGDAEVNWPEPGEVKYTWKGVTDDGKEASAEIEGPLNDRLDRVDVMGELPGFIKSLATAAAGTRPYIYQYGAKMKLKLKIGEEEIEEEGQVFAEATFIS
ncbi:survival factor 1 [Microthyrium microscopicum]|uniref:Survival factor 1 n=1 Tax=Microthyrium microscopicum TaxID=703497 RepID=A0A6A6ULZ1_9PEZI|nr:survival factor 1 [Microthyrium microscopicum]